MVSNAAKCALAALCLTLLFTAQDAMRRGAMRGQVDWLQAFAINALDWTVWAVLLPFIIIVGRRIRVDGSGSRAARVTAWVALGIAFCAVQGVLTGTVLRLVGGRAFDVDVPADVSVGRFLAGWTIATSSLNLLIFGMTAAVFHAVLYYRDLKTRQLREAELTARLARAELAALRTQLQPHFLFNALHTVSSVMVRDVPAAQRIVASLGDLLRASLEHTGRQEVSLRDELAFVASYLDIQKSRFRNRLAVDIDVPNELLDALVPSLLLQPLVENAIRHGIEVNPDGGTVRIRAARHDGRLALSVRDDATMESTARDLPARAGVGLTNTEARLAQLYGDDHAFRAARDGDGQFAVTLTLPYHTDAALFPKAGQGP